MEDNSLGIALSALHKVRSPAIRLSNLHACDQLVMHTCVHLMVLWGDPYYMGQLSELFYAST